jgi:L-asparaginase II
VRFLSTSMAPIAVATRSGLDESLHYGAGVVLDARGTVSASVGDPDLVIYPRSALKPLQATAMVSVGLDLPDDQMALVCASHDGDTMHLDGVRRLLDRFGLVDTDLSNTPSRPFGAGPRATATMAGVEPSSLQQNCSGKHAGMLATCRINGWPTDGYLDAAHPLQQHILSTIDGLARDVHHVGIDGCGAPTHALSLSRLAAAFASVAQSRSVVATAMSGRPEYVGGPRRDVTIWMRAVPGLIAKEGAAGVMALALPDGRAAAFKVGDGDDAARRAVTTEALRRMGVGVDGELATVVAEVAVPTLGHGLPVGELRALKWDECSS